LNQAATSAQLLVIFLFNR